MEIKKIDEIQRVKLSKNEADALFIFRYCSRTMQILNEVKKNSDLTEKQLKEIEKEILKADIGINPNNDGKVIRLAFPELNEERRKEIVKEIRKMAEEAKVAIRSIRREAIDDAREEEKNSIITEDDLKLAENNVQKLTDSKVEEIDKILESKEKEVMSI